MKENWYPVVHITTYSVICRCRKGLSWSWSYGSWIYNYLCDQCLPPLKLWVRTPFKARCTRYNIMWYSLSVTCGRSMVFSRYSGFFHQKTDHHKITEILLKVALITITLTLYWFLMLFLTPYEGILNEHVNSMTETEYRRQKYFIFKREILSIFCFIFSQCFLLEYENISNTSH